MNTNNKSAEQQLQDAADKAKKLGNEAKSTFLGLTPTMQYCVVGVLAIASSFLFGITVGAIVGIAGAVGVFAYNSAKGN